jgi:hypothetical protein
LAWGAYAKPQAADFDDRPTGDLLQPPWRYPRLPLLASHESRRPADRLYPTLKAFGGPLWCRRLWL